MASSGLPTTTSLLPTISTTTSEHLQTEPRPPSTTSTASTSAAQRSASLPIPTENPGGNVVRRPSIQFVTGAAQAGLPTGSPKPDMRRRMSSPPPPKAFQPRVSFDTFDNKDARDFSLTLQSKHRDYQYTRRSRTFLCGTDQNDYSEFALEWLIDELVDDGDEIVCLRVVDKDAKISSEASVEEGLHRQEAQKLLDQIIEKNTEDKAINLVLEFAVGKVHDTIQRMIRVYEPAILVVGTRGRSLGGIQGLLPGSVSKYCLQHSPVPVIVVRPTSKREKKKRKRQADPNRRGYLDILQRSGADTGLAGSSHSSFTEETLVAPEVEAEAVAAALGLPPDLAASAEPSPKGHDARTPRREPTSPETVSASDEVSPVDPRSPGIVMQSPTPDNLESPALSEGEPSDEGDEDDADEEAGFEGPSHVDGREAAEARAGAPRSENDTTYQDTSQSGPAAS